MSGGIVRLFALLAATPLCFAARSSPDAGSLVETWAEMLSKARVLVRAHSKLNLTDQDLVQALAKNPELQRDVARHVDGEEVSSALLERARGALQASGKMDAAVRRKGGGDDPSTPCHCVVQKVKDVSAKGDLEIEGQGIRVDLQVGQLLDELLDGSDFARVAKLKIGELKFTDFDGEGEGGDCEGTCFERCKGDSKFIIDRRELGALGVDRSRIPKGKNLVAAQCKDGECQCLDMDDTKVNIDLLNRIRDGGKKVDLATESLHVFDNEHGCLSECAGMCDGLEGSFGDDAKVDMEGVCFDEVDGNGDDDDD